MQEVISMAKMNMAEGDIKHSARPPSGWIYLRNVASACSEWKVCNSGALVVLMGLCLSQQAFSALEMGEHQQPSSPPSTIPQNDNMAAFIFQLFVLKAVVFGGGGCFHP